MGGSARGKVCKGGGVARGKGEQGGQGGGQGVAEDAWTMARSKSPAARGVTVSRQVAIPPELSPITVTCHQHQRVSSRDSNAKRRIINTRTQSAAEETQHGLDTVWTT